MGLPVAHLPSAWSPAADTLAGRTILVTGAAGGLGRAVSLACAAAGAVVVLSGRKVRPLEKLYDEILALGHAQPAILPLDLAGASPADYDTVIEALESAGGSLDGLVHAAAHFDNLTPLAIRKPELWLLDLQVNLSAPFLLTQACLPLLQAADDSAVVFVVDDPERMGRAHWHGYGVAKAGLERLASIWHQETDESNLRVHSLLPAPMRTALRHKAWFGENAGQVPSPDAAAEAVVYLLAPGAMAARGTLLDLRDRA